MPKRVKNKEHYAVIRGFYIAVPTIFSSWSVYDGGQNPLIVSARTADIDFRGDAHPVVTGFSGSGLSGFETLAEAEDYMDSKGVAFYKYDIKYGAGKTSPIKGEEAYYAVANGRTPGIQGYY